MHTRLVVRYSIIVLERQDRVLKLWAIRIHTVFAEVTHCNTKQTFSLTNSITIDI